MNEARPLDFEAVLQSAYEAILEEGDNAIEPVKEFRDGMEYEIWRSAPELRSAIEILPFAVGEKSGSAEFVLAMDALAYRGLRERAYDVPTRTERVQVEVKRLDELFPDLPSLKYIKIDAEGGEYHALRGGMRCVEKFRPMISIEFGESSIADYGIACEDMGRLLIHEFAYGIRDIRGRRLETVEAFSESARMQRIWDYIAVPRENRSMDDRIVRTMKPSAG